MNNEEQFRNEDEIDLSELVGVLFKRWKWIISITILCVLIGIFYSLTLKESYKTTSTIQIGQYLNSNQEYEFIQQPDAVGERIKAFSNNIYVNFKEKYGEKNIKFSLKEDFQVNTLPQGGIIEIELSSPKDSAPEEFVGSVVKKLVSSHERLFKVRAQKYHQRIQEIEANIKENKQKIQSYNNTLNARLENLDQRINSYKSRLNLLDKQKEYLKGQIEDSSQRINELIKSKSTANLSSNQEPIGLLLFSSEIQRIRSYISKLQTRLIADIPNKKKSLQLKIENTYSETASTKAEMLSKIQNVKSSITSLNAQLNTQKTSLNNILRTNIISKPDISDNPVSHNYKLFFAISMVLGLFLGVFAAFLREFWVMNRDKILGRENH